MTSAFRVLLATTGILLMAAASGATEVRLSKEDEVEANKWVLLTIICYWETVPKLDDPDSSVEFMTKIVQDHCESEIWQRISEGKISEIVGKRAISLLLDVQNKHRIMIAREIIEHRQSTQ